MIHIQKLYLIFFPIYICIENIIRMDPEIPHQEVHHEHEHAHHHHQKQQHYFTHSIEIAIKATS